MYSEPASVLYAIRSASVVIIMTDQTAKLPAGGLSQQPTGAEPISAVREHVRQVLLRFCKSATRHAPPALEHVAEAA